MHDSIEQLRELLPASQAPIVGDSAANVVAALANCWHLFEGHSETSMDGSKIRSDRVEELRWSDPQLTFTIERHPQTVRGSIYADVYSWKVNIETMTARCDFIKRRQVNERAQAFDVRRIAKTVWESIASGGGHDALRYWSGDDVTIELKGLLSNKLAKQTREARSKRLRDALVTEASAQGWALVDQKGSPRFRRVAAKNNE